MKPRDDWEDDFEDRRHREEQNNARRQARRSAQSDKWGEQNEWQAGQAAQKNRRGARSPR